MSWTEERVERLSTLWLEGRSASQIAAELGEGVSRNAVIGKVHRLGLSGRAAPPAAGFPAPSSPVPDASLLVCESVPAEAEAPAAAEASPVEPTEAASVAPAAVTTAAVTTAAVTTAAATTAAATTATHTVDDVASILEAAAEPITVDLPALRAAAPAPRATVATPAPRAAGATALPVSDRVTILELSGSMCRWPIGDPTNAEFRFCGCRAMGTLPYCSEHARVAFQPVADRRRTERMIRIA